MNERLQDLINWLIANKSISCKADFAARVGLGKTFLSDILAGRSKITERTCELISQAFPEVNADWLLTGEGSMFLPARQNTLPDALATILDMLNTLSKKYDALEKRYAELSAMLIEEKERQRENRRTWGGCQSA